jgi:hypothetical protein
MAESIVQVTEGSGKKLHTNSYTVGANTVEDEFVVLGPYPYATYTVYATAVSGATAASHTMQLMAGGTNKVRVQRITVQQLAVVAAANRFEIVRLTTAGTGGTAITARPYDTSDAAAGAAGMTLPGAKGTEGVFLGSLMPNMMTAVGTTNRWEWTAGVASKPITIPAGTTNGIALKVSGLAASTYDIEIMFVETAF